MVRTSCRTAAKLKSAALPAMVVQVVAVKVAESTEPKVAHQLLTPVQLPLPVLTKATDKVKAEPPALPVLLHKVRTHHRELKATTKRAAKALVLARESKYVDEPIPDIHPSS